ncbi:peptide chain release factor N(5)-glutamine methyltransferase [Candidatus Gracilibacteria bacterium]|nr:peptide chain release factor N(5)-glutamine methyltransferase [Candidatus Gracilibacteria bacterium]
MNKLEIISEGKKFGVQKDNVERIIQKISGLSKEELFLLDDISITVNQFKKIKEDFRKLSFGYPFEYILESAEFYGLEFFVDKRCLIPRDDTEVMVDQCLKVIDKMEGEVEYIDVGTGSGAIPISVVSNTNKLNSTSLGLDISPEALEVASLNVDNYKLEDKIVLIESNLLSVVFENKLYKKGSNLIITANLPYIKEEDYGNMDKEVILHEPSLALYGGKKTGFEMYEKLISEVSRIKQVGNVAQAVLFIEIGFDQKVIAKDFLDKQKLLYKIHCDNSGVDRCIEINF